MASEPLAAMLVECYRDQAAHWRQQAQTYRALGDAELAAFCEQWAADNEEWARGTARKEAAREH